MKRSSRSSTPLFSFERFAEDVVELSRVPRLRKKIFDARGFELFFAFNPVEVSAGEDDRRFGMKRSNLSRDFEACAVGEIVVGDDQIGTFLRRAQEALRKEMARWNS